LHRLAKNAQTGFINKQKSVCFSFQIMQLSVQSLNFTFELYLVEDGKFGSVDENGNWDGLIGELVLGRAEIALGPISGLL
jgi:hypothetical protein